jgi:Mg/Co/Ni transporter MgtE
MTGFARHLHNAHGRLLGLVTVGDAMDILDRESAEDLARTGGASEPLNRPSVRHHDTPGM